MWLGFIAWYRGLALGLGMLFAMALLGETLDAVTPGFGLAVIVGVLVGIRMPVSQATVPRQSTRFLCPHRPIAPHLCHS